MAAKRRTARKRATTRSLRSAPDERYLIALGADGKTIYVAGEVATLRNAKLWMSLAHTAGRSADIVVKTIVATSKRHQVALLGGSLGPRP
jgi:hypothetical protein